MKRLLVLGLFLALGMSAAYASRERIHVHFTYGYTGARGLKACTAFVTPIGSLTPTYTVVLDNDGAPPLTNYSSVINTDSLTDWAVLIRVTDSNGIVTPIRYEATTRTREYSRWGTRSYEDDWGRLFNGGFEYDSADFSASAPAGWTVTSGGTLASTVPANTVDSNRSRYALRLSGSTALTFNAYSRPLTFRRGELVKYGFDAYSASSAPDTLVAYFVLLGTTGSTTNTVIDSLAVTTPHVTGGWHRYSRWIPAPVTTLTNQGATATNYYALRIKAVATAALPLNWFLDNAFVSSIGSDSVRFVAITDTLRKATISATVDYGLIAKRVWDTSDAHDVAVAGDLSGCGAGSGINLVQVRTLKTPGNAPILGARVSAITDSAQPYTVVATNQTTASGATSLNLNNGTYYLLAWAPGYTFTNKFITVSAGKTDTLFATEFNPGSPVAATLCRVYAWIDNPTPLRGVTVTASLRGTNLMDTVSNPDQIVSPHDLSTTTNNVGYWALDLVRTVRLNVATTYQISARRSDGTVIFNKPFAVLDSTQMQFR